MDVTHDQPERDMSGHLNPVLDANETRAAVGTYLRSERDEIRCAAVQTLCALGADLYRSALVELLLDEDPDVRTDAMAALATCATAQEAEVIIYSLMGDPVKDVKSSAIKALAHMNHLPCLPLLHRLVQDRCEDEITWEDGDGLWDDWLDIQIETLAALGRFGQAESVAEILQARDDEFGQNIDAAAFTALARIKDGGIAALLGLARTGADHTRTLAVQSLANIAPDIARPLADLFVLDKDARVRIVAVRLLDAENQYVDQLCLRDIDANIRAAALTQFAPKRPGLSLEALKDTDETVIATAVQFITEAPEDLDANLVAWMQTAGPELSAQSAGALQRLYPDHAVEWLFELAANTARPITARLAALATLGKEYPASFVQTSDLLQDPAQQIRLAVLKHLSSRAQKGDPDALVMLEKVISGDVDPEAFSATEAAPVEDLATSRVEVSDSRIKILPDGSIEETEGSDSEPVSTLSLIQDANQIPEGDDQDGHISHAKRRKRVAVEGPAAFAEDLQLNAIRFCAKIQNPSIDIKLVDVLERGDANAKRAVYETLAARADTKNISGEALSVAKQGMNDEDPIIRFCALKISATAADASAALQDKDALIRALAISLVGPDEKDAVIAGFSDAVGVVREAALCASLSNFDRNTDVLVHGLCGSLAAGYQDTLAAACTISEAALGWITQNLKRGDLTTRDALLLLNAILTSAARLARKHS